LDWDKLVKTPVIWSNKYTADVEKLLEKIEEDDDVMNVYHTMQE
jgi:transcriptional/translational regulatory protein YebC/TACO1